MRIHDKLISSNKIKKPQNKKMNTHFSDFLPLTEMEKQSIIVKYQTILTNKKQNHQKKYQAIRKGEKILKILKELQHNIIIGYSSQDSIKKIINLLEKPLLTESLNDSNLEHILQDLEIRAYVESAKLKKLTKI